MSVIPITTEAIAFGVVDPDQSALNVIMQALSIFIVLHVAIGIVTKLAARSVISVVMGDFN